MFSKSIKLIIESKTNHVIPLARAVRAICGTDVQDEILLHNLELRLFEAVMNVIKHVYHLKPGNFVEIIVKLEEIMDEVSWRIHEKKNVILMMKHNDQK